MKVSIRSTLDIPRDQIEFVEQLAREEGHNYDVRTQDGVRPPTRHELITRYLIGQMQDAVDFARERWRNSVI